MRLDEDSLDIMDFHMAVLDISSEMLRVSMSALTVQFSVEILKPRAAMGMAVESSISDRRC